MIFSHIAPDGEAETHRARTLDVSGSGLQVKSRKPLAAGSYVYVRSEQVNFLVGGAYVRHCARRGWAYRVGLEFRRPLPNRF